MLIGKGGRHVDLPSGLRALVNVGYNTDQMITDFEQSFEKLKIEFIMGSSLQATLTTFRILEHVQFVGTP